VRIGTQQNRSRLAVFRKKTPNEAPALWIATTDLPSTPATVFYSKTFRVLA
jgi:hypothetical protein